MDGTRQRKEVYGEKIKIKKIKAVLGKLARGTEARKYGPMTEETGSACNCKTKH